MGFIKAAIPIIYICAGTAFSLLAVVWCLCRRRRIQRFINCTILRRNQYNYRLIFRHHLEKLKHIEDHHNLFAEILATTCRVIDANGASLVIREKDNSFRICSSRNLGHFSFNAAELEKFVSWLEKNKTVVTREQLVNDKKLQCIKSDGLRYCVLANAEACVPLFLNDKLYGIINIGKRNNQDFDSQTCDLLLSFSIYFTSLIRNIDLQEELSRQKLSLEQALRLRNYLLSNLSHELRTPLNSIVGLSEIIESGEDGPLTEDQQTHISMINQSGQRLLKAINNIVDLSKIEANHLELNVQRLNLRRMLEDISSTIRFSKYTKFNMEIGDDAASVYGDETRLRQVFQNLLDNAAKFTKQGKVAIEAAKSGEMLKVKITDTGIGIPANKQEEILNGLTQAEDLETRQHEGLGLGLIMSRKIVQLHGGRLWFTSQQGRGSDFYVTLPLKPISICHPEITLS
ncbi:MAG: HAMP domain-containing sensor histidine kinase [Pseudomonadota bacterium]